MKASCFATFLIFFISFVSINAQVDPFYGNGTFAESPFSSPVELPDFKPYVQGLDMNKIKITTVEPYDLKSLIDTRSRLFLIDTREQNEFEVGHIKGSKKVGYNNFSVEKVWMLDRNTTIILCSTDDTRIKHVGAYMKMMGFVDVRAISGSLIAWLNNGYTLVDKNGQLSTDIFLKSRDDAKKLRKGKAVFE
jgi:rhodanese-related sulfurtransferase